MNAREQQLESLRSSAAIVLAMAVKKLFPTVQLGDYQVNDSGFSYDFNFLEENIGERDLAKIEEEMFAIYGQDLSIKQIARTKQESVELFGTEQPFKTELIEAAKSRKFVYAVVGDAFTDLIHTKLTKSTQDIGFVKLVSVAGAYWKGDDTRQMLTRIYGVTFPTKDELELYLAYKEEAQRRDHRAIGKKLLMFSPEPSIGAGLPIFQARGAFALRELADFVSQTYKENHFMPIVSPTIALTSLYEMSGAATADSQFLFKPMVYNDEEQYQLRLSFKQFHLFDYMQRQRSYRDLPWKTAEIGKVFSYEKSSDLQGLLVTREFVKDEATTVCTDEQLENEIERQLIQIITILRGLGLHDLEVLGYVKMSEKSQQVEVKDEWNNAVETLKNAVRKAGYTFKDTDLVAEYFGPKIEIVYRDSLKRHRKLSVMEIDVISSRKLALEYTGKDGLTHMPVVISRSIAVSYEKLLAILIENTGGNLPLWLQFEKVRILPVNGTNEMYAESLEKQLKQSGIYTTVDYTNEPLEGKIRQAEEDKIPYILVVGEKEQGVNGVSVRLQSIGDLGLMMFDNFIASVKEEIVSKSIKTLLI